MGVSKGQHCREWSSHEMGTVPTARSMRETEEFGGLLYMDNTLDPTPAPTILSTSRFFPLALLTLPVITLVLVFVAPVASAGASLAGSDLGWAALVSGGVAAAYSIGYQLRQCRHSSAIPERTTPSRLTQLVAHTLASVSRSCRPKGSITSRHRNWNWQLRWEDCTITLQLKKPRQAAKQLHRHN